MISREATCYPWYSKQIRPVANKGELIVQNGTVPMPAIIEDGIAIEPVEGAVDDLGELGALKMQSRQSLQRLQGQEASKYLGHAHAATAKRYAMLTLTQSPPEGTK